MGRAALCPAKVEEPMRNATGSVRMAAARVLLSAVLAAAACNQNTGGAGSDGGDAGSDDAAIADLSGPDLTGPSDAGCVPQVSSCTNLCGKIKDGCTGEIFQCGGCGSGLVCDLEDTHACITPKI